MEIKSSLDGMAWGITLAVCTLFAILISRWGYTLLTVPLGRTAMLIVAGKIALAVTLLVVPFLFSPQGYSLSDDSLTIRRLAGSVVVPRAKIQQVQELGPKDTSDLVRSFGVGGLFGYYGKYWSSSQGAMKFFARNRRKLLMLELSEGQKIIISPDLEGHDALLRELAPS